MKGLNKDDNTKPKEEYHSLPDIDLKQYIEERRVKDIENISEQWLRVHLPQLGITEVSYKSDQLSVSYKNKVAGAEKLITDSIEKMKSLGNNIDKLIVP